MPTLKTAQREWARLGAQTRLHAIQQERLAILKAFPELRRSGVSLEGLPGKKRQFSEAARRRMSAGMRKYWARRRAAGKAKNKAS